MRSPRCAIRSCPRSRWRAACRRWSRFWRSATPRCIARATSTSRPISTWSSRPSAKASITRRCNGPICPLRQTMAHRLRPGVATSAVLQRQKMFDDAINALTQIFAPPLRAVLWKSVALALALIVVVGIALDRLILWLVGAGSASIETTLGPQAHWPASALAWLLSVAASLGIIVGSVFLMPAVTAFVASFFADQIADEVEREHYPADPPGKALPL